TSFQTNILDVSYKPLDEITTVPPGEPPPPLGGVLHLNASKIGSSHKFHTDFDCHLENYL
ncbi:hypothetical protein, partial [uncultured Muribaculum sp.]|uniref:hypothetical protein n=1 Tax=uncultured Muribaculum sp. TaxID=1918613 RepID=UPI0026F27273